MLYGSEVDWLPITELLLLSMASSSSLVLLSGSSVLLAAWMQGVVFYEEL